MCNNQSFFDVVVVRYNLSEHKINGDRSCFAQHLDAHVHFKDKIAVFPR